MIPIDLGHLWFYFKSNDIELDLIRIMMKYIAIIGKYLHKNITNKNVTASETRFFLNKKYPFFKNYLQIYKFKICCRSVIDWWNVILKKKSQNEYSKLTFFNQDDFIANNF